MIRSGEHAYFDAMVARDARRASDSLALGVIDRPDVEFDPVAHAYKLEGEDVLGVSTIAKVGGVDDTWGIASAWGFRIGYEGANAVLHDHVESGRHGDTEGRWERCLLSWPEDDELREELKRRGLTPWAKRDKAAERGTNVHAVLERLAQDTADVPSHAEIEAMPAEQRGHVRSIIRWFLAMRPTFVAMEVQVASRQHRFAGRYDLRVLIDAERILPSIDPVRQDAQAERIRALAADGKQALALVDLKTSKGVYPTTHFPQLEGYELASVEMGFPATDCRAVLNTGADGTFDPARDFAVSWATCDHFVAYAGAMRAIRKIKACDPERIRARAQEEAILANLPARSADLARMALPELDGLDSRSIGRILGKMRKRGLVEQVPGGTWQAV